MSYTSWPWGSNAGDREFTAEELTSFLKSRHSDGVSYGLEIVPSSGMSVKLSDGFASIKGTIFKAEEENGEATTVSCGDANGTYAKYVSIMLRRTASQRKIEPIAKQGAAAANPTPPVVQRDDDVYEIRLADILIPKGATEITQKMIYSKILGTECGMSVNQPVALDTEKYLLQLEALFDDVKSTLSEDQAGNLFNLINQFPKIIICTDATKPPVQEGALLIQLNA